MTTVCSGDNYLGWTALLTVALQLFCFFIAYTCQFDLITDLAGSLNFVLIALFTFFAGGHYYPRQIIATSLVLVARVYLGGYLFSRVIKRGHDARFNEIRGRFASFLIFWIFQMIWVSLRIV